MENIVAQVSIAEDLMDLLSADEYASIEILIEEHIKEMTTNLDRIMVVLKNHTSSPEKQQQYLENKRRQKLLCQKMFPSYMIMNNNQIE